MQSDGMNWKIVGRHVHFPTSEGNLVQGEIVAAWLDTNDDSEYNEIRVTVRLDNKTFKDAWLGNCTDGRIPEPKEPK